MHMRKITIVLLCFLIGTDATHRVKRKIIFSKNSKMFFRVNGKDNVIPSNQIFAHGWAVRVNWDLPDTLHKRYKFFKRDIHNEIETVSGAPLEGYSCILHYICQQINYITSFSNCGILCEIGKLITNSESVEADFFKSLTNKCDDYKDICINSNNKIFK